ncbi:hypothetical protein GS528_27795 [Rhodococcus hoagii]|nr:hypothetical protein [Prescottella equi]
MNLYRDYARASEAVNAAERKYGLEVIESRENGTGDRAYHRAEHQRAQRVGHSELDRTVLARRVRACASASKSEAEFVRRLRGQGLIVRHAWRPGVTTSWWGTRLRCARRVMRVAVTPNRSSTVAVISPRI